MHESMMHLSRGLAPVFKERHWRKRALTWHKAEPETVLAFHAEKNRWGANRYSFHCGVYIRALGNESTPPFFRCPVQVTLDRIVPDAAHLERISDFDDESLSLTERIDAITAAVKAHALPWLEAHATLRGLRALVEIDYDELLPQVQVWRTTYDYLREMPALKSRG
jgi:hypothetical protein